MSGIKYDQQKPDLSMIPFSAKCGIAKAFMDGERKYGRYNYLGGMEWTRLLAAVERHISAFNDGEDCAPDSGLNHLYHAGAGICMLIEYYEKQLGTDNRYKSMNAEERNALVQKLETDARKLGLNTGVGSPAGDSISFYNGGKNG